MTKKVAVLTGGCSAERGVSLSSGRNVLQALKEAGYEAFPLDLSHDLIPFVETLKTERPDVVFNALHGRYGEDGCVQGVLDLMQIPYTHSGRMASALAMDKIMSKKLFRMAGLPVAVDRIVSKEDILTGNVLPHPYVLKPVRNGSSVGVFICRDENRKPFEGERYPYADDEEIMAEEYIDGRELTVAVMNGKALGVLEIIPNEKFYNYKAKYSEGGARHVIPANLPEEDYQKALYIAEEAHKILGCRGISRTDMRYDDTHPNEKPRFAVLETNTQPGMTSLSLVPEIAQHAGFSYKDIVVWMVENAQWGE